MVIDPLVSTSLGASVFLVALVLAVKKIHSFEESYRQGIDSTTVYSLIVLLILFPISITYTVMAFALGTGSIDYSTLTMLKYVEWSISSPLMLAGILLISQDRKLLTEGIFAQATLLMTGFAAGMLTGILENVLWTMVAISLSVVMYKVWIEGRTKIKEKDQDLRDIYIQTSILVVALWSLYAFYLPLSYDGFGIVSYETSRAVFTGLDIVTKLGFCIFVLNRIKKLEKL